MASPRLATGSEVARAVALALLWTALVLSAATVLLFSQPAVSGLASYVHGGSPDEATLLESAEQARRFTVGVESQVVFDPSGIVGLDGGALEHLLDVRTIVRLAGLVLGVAIALSLVAVAAAVADPANLAVTAASLRWAGVGIGATVVVAAAVVGVGFDWFFVTFHHLLFAEGTWTFSSESLLIRTFPEPFWVAAAVGWLAAVVVLAVILLVASTAVRVVAARRRERTQLVP